MRIGETLLTEFDHEMANTRKTLERIPAGKFDYKPHPKSATMGWMAWHLSNLPHWIAITMQTDSLDLAAPFPPRETPADTQAVLTDFDNNVREARAALEKAEDSAMMAPWTLRKGGHVIMTMPRVAIIRGMALNHLVHHRGQLSVYLRLNDIPVPALYGPSADEGSL
jgi:uncharacterized damage-inducible protein DinB